MLLTVGIKVVDMPKAYMITKIISRLTQEYPDSRIALNYSNPVELLVATILSARCTDEMVNRITSHLFLKYKTLDDYAQAALEIFEQDIRAAGFYHNKAKNIINAAKKIRSDYDGNVPKTMDEIITLPGVARKTANIVLYNAYGVNAGIAVDTHVKRLSRRLKMTLHMDPDKIEKDLMQQVPKSMWGSFPYLLIEHGRKVCTARQLKCRICILNDFCPSSLIE
ncbi:MAG: endonuclease III [Dehalococcoidia bacterium]|nr:MAG: endonuclease III [Dehalococcoidia bacterium]